MGEDPVSEVQHHESQRLVNREKARVMKISAVLLVVCSGLQLACASRRGAYSDGGSTSGDFAVRGGRGNRAGNDELELGEALSSLAGSGAADITCKDNGCTCPEGKVCDIVCSANKCSGAEFVGTFRSVHCASGACRGLKSLKADKMQCLGTDACYGPTGSALQVKSLQCGEDRPVDARGACAGGFRVKVEDLKCFEGGCGNHKHDATGGNFTFTGAAPRMFCGKGGCWQPKPPGNDNGVNIFHCSAGSKCEVTCKSGGRPPKEDHGGSCMHATFTGNFAKILCDGEGKGGPFAACAGIRVMDKVTDVLKCQGGSSVCHMGAILKARKVLCTGDAFFNGQNICGQQSATGQSIEIEADELECTKGCINTKKIVAKKLICNSNSCTGSEERILAGDLSCKNGACRGTKMNVQFSNLNCEGTGSCSGMDPKLDPAAAASTIRCTAGADCKLIEDMIEGGGLARYQNLAAVQLAGDAIKWPSKNFPCESTDKWYCPHAEKDKCVDSQEKCGGEVTKSRQLGKSQAHDPNFSESSETISIEATAITQTYQFLAFGSLVDEKSQMRRVEDYGEGYQGLAAKLVGGVRFISGVVTGVDTGIPTHFSLPDRTASQEPYTFIPN